VLSVVLSVLGFLAVLGPLVIVHEFGHYIFARIFRVKAEIFSIGFGPKLWAKQYGETELRVSAIPLGGYVKLLGEDGEANLPEDLQKRTLQAQAPWRRFFIFFGGPLFNFIFAIFVFVAILLIGEPQIASVFSRVVTGSPAAEAGFQSGDKVLAVNEKPVNKFEQIIIEVNEHPGKVMKFQVRHLDAPQPAEISIVPKPVEGFTVYGESTKVGDIEGIYPHPRGNSAGISNPSTAAAKAGIKTGDKIIYINGQSVQNWEELERLYRAVTPGSKFSLGVEAAANSAQKLFDVSLSRPLKSHSLAVDTGLHSSELFIDKTMPSSPAESAGLKPGDRVVTIRGQEIESFFGLRDVVQISGEKDGQVVLTWERQGKIHSAKLIPTASNVRDPVLKKTTQYTIGIVPMLSLAEAPTLIERTWNPIKLFGLATERMAVLTWRNLVSLKKMVTGDVSVATLGGPILIGKIAGESIARGLIAFLTTMGILSVGLGILNVLPVPVLDGGHLLLLGIESIRGKPLTIRQMEIIQQVGLSLILALMIVVIRNDIARLPIFN